MVAAGAGGERVGEAAGGGVEVLVRDVRGLGAGGGGGGGGCVGDHGGVLGGAEEGELAS